MRSPPSKNATSLSADTVDVRLVHAEELLLYTSLAAVSLKLSYVHIRSSSRQFQPTSSFYSFSQLLSCDNPVCSHWFYAGWIKRFYLWVIGFLSKLTLRPQLEQREQIPSSRVALTISLVLISVDLGRYWTGGCVFVHPKSIMPDPRRVARPY